MKKIVYSFLGIALLASCTAEEDMQRSGEGFADKVTISCKPFEFEGGETRTTLTNTGSKIEFGWRNGEAIGIFPVAPTTNIQAKQVLSVSQNSTSATFDGAGWALKRGNTYAAYSPYQNMLSETSYTAIPIDMTGQVQNGNNNLDHIGNGYDFMYATASVPSEGGVNFEFNHACAIVMLELTMPEAGEWKNVTLTSENEVFVTKATMNVSTGVVTSVIKSNSISLNLNNVSTTAANEKITLYLSVLPCTTGKVDVSVINNIGKEFLLSSSSKKFEKGKAYRLEGSTSFNKIVDGENNGHDYVNLGLSVKWATCNIGAENVEDAGLYFAWGETYNKTRFTWGTYMLCNGNNSNMYVVMTKYDNSQQEVLQPSNDIASQTWKGDWHTPTYEEIRELLLNTSKRWISDYNGTGISGYELNSTIEGYENQKIFLPTTGYMDNNSHEYSLSYYWSSTTRHADSYKTAYTLGFNASEISDYVTYRYCGCPVRAVCP